MKLPLNTECSHTTSPLGPISLATAGEKLLGIWFDGQTHMPDLSGFKQTPDHPVLQRAAQQLAQYFAGQRIQFDLPLDLSHGTAFQQIVWQALRQIAPGDTCSYQTVAKTIGRPKAVRAVAAAIGRNPLTVMVPCHRVVGANGALTGYAGGLERKSALLHLEGAR
jgi:methylated-DNA-[protein]-cysteine S-methyltransferase